MKVLKNKFLTICLLALSMPFSAFALEQKNENPTPTTVKVIFKNAGFWPKKVTVIGYAPGASDNSTVAYFLMPGGTKAVTYPVGTRLFKANQKQVDFVMSGKSIAKDSAFYVVKAVDQNKIIEF